MLRVEAELVTVAVAKAGNDVEQVDYGSRQR